jgi:hypothetical protein
MVISAVAEAVVVAFAPREDEPRAGESHGKLRTAFNLDGT